MLALIVTVRCRLHRLLPTSVDGRNDVRARAVASMHGLGAGGRGAAGAPAGVQRHVHVGSGAQRGAGRAPWCHNPRPLPVRLSGGAAPQQRTEQDAAAAHDCEARRLRVTGTRRTTTTTTAGRVTPERDSGLHSRHLKVTSYKTHAAAACFNNTPWQSR